MKAKQRAYSVAGRTNSLLEGTGLYLLVNGFYWSYLDQRNNQTVATFNVKDGSIRWKSRHVTRVRNPTEATREVIEKFKRDAETHKSPTTT